MSNILLHTAYFPPLSYFALISKNDKFLIEIYEHFPKQTLRNRTYILTANGKMPLIVPVKKGRSGKTLTKDIEISYAENWSKKHLNAIISAYKSSPFFDFYFEDYKYLFETRHKYLIDLNNKILQIVARQLNINLNFSYTTDFVVPLSLSNDFRYRELPKAKVNIPYIQVFSDRFDFIPDLSILDVLFNLGPEASVYLKNYTKKL